MRGENSHAKVLPISKVLFAILESEPKALLSSFVRVVSRWQSPDPNYAFTPSRVKQSLVSILGIVRSQGKQRSSVPSVGVVSLD